MTQYIYNGKEISHTSFISLCMSNGINGGRKMSFYEKLVQMAEQGNERAKNIMANLEVREVETQKKQEEPSLHSPKNRYHVEVHFPEPLENLGSVVSFGTMNLDGIYVNFLQQKIDELKYVTSNQDSNNGIVPSGVTAGSAISALQESAGKNARSSNKTFHRAYREVCYQIVELIRQFYDIPRTFRIAPEDAMGEQFIQFDNSGIKLQEQTNMGSDMGLRLPEFDIDVTTEKANPYKKMEMNELALNFYNLGFFNPQMTDQALACLNMMDFTKKEELMQKIQMNGTMQEMLLRYQQLALQYASMVSPQDGQQVAQMILSQGGQQMPQQMGSMVSLEGDTSEHPFNEKAREQARASTQAD
jgi:hypothetical protein